MAVIGVDIGDAFTHISVAELGGVETIFNDYSLRATPTIVALGDRQRFVGVAADSQRNLHPHKTVSYFKNTLAKSVKELEAQLGGTEDFGAPVVGDDHGRAVFDVVGGERFSPEQMLAMVFTKVKELVRSATSQPVETCVVSVPIYFTSAQRSAVVKAAKIAEIPVQEIISDLSALTLAYGKSRTDLPVTEDQPRNVVLVDCGSEGLQAGLVAFSRDRANILATSASHVGGKCFDKALIDHLIQVIEEKYAVNIRNNKKAVNKLRNVIEKVKKQTSANSNVLPVQIDSLVEDIDVQLTIDRATVEKLIQPYVAEVKSTLENLLISTTVKKENIHSVEIVGGSTRIPLIKKVIQDVFGVGPSSCLNADEAVSRGSALHAASLSTKFITKRFTVAESVLQSVEAVFVYGGNHEKVMIYDEGERVGEERRIEINADLPLNIALQYCDGNDIDNKFIALYQVEGSHNSSGSLELKFRHDPYGMIELREVLLKQPQEMSKRRRTSECLDVDDGERREGLSLKFTRSLSNELTTDDLHYCIGKERAMVARDQEEIHRQEEKNRLEEELYESRAGIVGNCDGGVEEEEAYIKIKELMDGLETWLYEEGEDAPRQAYMDSSRNLREKVRVYKIWHQKFLQMKAKEEERRKFMEAEQKEEAEKRQKLAGDDNFRPRTGPAGGPREIPVVYRGNKTYVPRENLSHPGQMYLRGGGVPRGGARDPFRGFGPADFFDPMFGW